MKKQLIIIVCSVLSLLSQAQNKRLDPLPGNSKLDQSKPGQVNNPDTPRLKISTVTKSIPTLKALKILSIPAEGFRASNKYGGGSYYKIRPNGLGTLAGDRTTGPVANTLVAPLQLPDGAIIKNVDLNIVSLSGESWIPHLVLMQKGMINTLRQRGGYTKVTEIHNYSFTSSFIENQYGLPDVKTIVSKTMNYKIDNKNGAYYFEILANKLNRLPMDPEVAWWPNDSHLFIWSVVVYYELD